MFMLLTYNSFANMGDFKTQPPVDWRYSEVELEVRTL